MSEQPEGRTKDSEKAARNNIEQQQPEPMDKQDPTEPVKVTGRGSSETATETGANSTL